jgi:hypothetical protein
MALPFEIRRDTTRRHTFHVHTADDPLIIIGALLRFFRHC